MNSAESPFNRLAIDFYMEAINPDANDGVLGESSKIIDWQAKEGRKMTKLRIIRNYVEIQLFLNIFFKPHFHHLPMGP